MSENKFLFDETLMEWKEKKKTKEKYSKYFNNILGIKDYTESVFGIREEALKSCL